jgi:hypothetical protein
VLLEILRSLLVSAQRIEWLFAPFGAFTGDNGPAKVHRLLQDSLGLGACDCLVAKVGSMAMGGLPKHKVCLRSFLEL